MNGVVRRKRHAHKRHKLNIQRAYYMHMLLNRAEFRFGYLVALLPLPRRVDER